MRKFFFGIAVLVLFSITEDLCAQTKPSTKTVDLIYQNEEENLQVFHQWIRWNNPGSLLMNHLIKLASYHFDLRDQEIAKLTTPKAWTDRQQMVSKKLAEMMGPFPEKGPLKAIITGIVKKESYRIEKIVYESRPGFYVTGCLFIPDRIKGKAPAVLNLIGHEQESFRATLDQVIILNLVRKGIVVFTIDPLGQGEHVQYFDPKVNFSSIGYSVVEHCYFGNQCFLSGYSSAKYFIWDGIRAIDYLVTRKEVDADKIGVTGFSGGGTVTAYLAAFDDRVKVSVPCSWSTASRRQLETKGAQDAEATLANSLAKGITFEDLLEVRAPKPALLTFVSRDQYLTLQGAREAYQEASKVYAMFKKTDQLQFVEDDSKHWLTPKIRVAIYAFFMKHFGLTGDPSETEIELLSAEDLTVTRTGQIASSFGGDMVFDVNKRESLPLIAALEKSRKNIGLHLENVRKNAKEISGYIEPSAVTSQPFINGKYQRDGYSVAKYAIQGEGDYAIPMLLFVPDDTLRKHPGIVYLHATGKITDAKPGGEIEKLVKKGYVVVAADVIGVGETKNTATRGIADGYTGVLLGRSIVGIQAGDIVRVVRYLKGLSNIDSTRVGAIGLGDMGIPLIHAAAFDLAINNITVIGSPISYKSIVMNRLYKVGLEENKGGGTHHPYEVNFSWGVASVLTGYDIPDLIGCIAPRKVVLLQIKDQLLQPASDSFLNEELSFSRAAYEYKKASSNIRILNSEESFDTQVDWCFK